MLSESRTTTNPYSKTYTYDYEGNILTVNSSTYATYDNANKFASIPSGTFTYDNFGSLTYISSPVHPTTTYGYNGKNETTYIQTSAGRTDYKYNEQSLRVVKIPPTSTAKRWYVFSGTTLIGEVSSSGATLAYTHGADGLVSMRDVTTNTSRFFHYGAQGETRYLTNSSGTVTDSYYYEAYGNSVASSGSTYNPYRYGGKFGYYNDDLGESLLATWRWYSPSQMRWINRDPIKFDGGSNVYQYVSGNPVKFVDPSGLELTSALDAATEVVSSGGGEFPPPNSGLLAVGVAYGLGYGVGTMVDDTYHNEISEGLFGPKEPQTCSFNPKLEAGNKRPSLSRCLNACDMASSGYFEQSQTFFCKTYPTASLRAACHDHMSAANYSLEKCRNWCSSVSL